MSQPRRRLFSIFTATALSSLLFFIVLTIAYQHPTALYAAPSMTTWYVNPTTGNDGNSCLASGTACATIAAAIDKASDDDIISLAAGTYLEHDIYVGKRLTFQGAGASTTIVDAHFAGRGMHVAATATLADVTIQNGAIVTTSGVIFDTGGAAILATGDLTIQNVVLTNNHAQGSGGAIFNNGIMNIENTSLISNTADGIGGGIYNYTLGGFTMTNSLIMDNTAVGIQGGGIYSNQPIYLYDVAIINNAAASFGGGMMPIDSALLDGVTFTGNTAAAGAAIFAQSGALTLTNVTVSGNIASNNYGGIYISGPSTTLYLQNSTVTNNARTNSAGNGFNGVLTGNNATATIVNSIISDHEDNNCGGNIVSLGYNIADDNSCSLAATGDMPNTNPLLAPLANYGGSSETHALEPNSPAIDSGDNSTCALMDQRNVARPYDGDNDGIATCDIGAFEARHHLSIADTIINEGSSSTTTAFFTVTLSPASDIAVSVVYSTSNGSATAGSDFIDATNVITFNPGITQQLVMIDIVGDTADEVDETFVVELSAPAGADIIDGIAEGTIIDDDGLSGLSITDQTVLEGNSGTTTAVFTVTLSPSSTNMVTVDYQTVISSADSSDYTPVMDSLTFSPGETTKIIEVSIIGDVVDEMEREEFGVLLSAPTNASLSDAYGLGTITDDDTARLSQTVGPQQFEGDSGLSTMVFTITLSTPADFTITVDYDLSPGFGDSGATPGEDYIDEAGTLTFLPGETVQYITVDIIGDTVSELDERFSSTISNANAPIQVNGSNAIILNDDDFKLFLPAAINDN